MDKNNSEKREGFFQRLINAVRNMFGGGDKKAADTTAVTTANASDLSRVEMLEMLVELGKENARLKADLEEKDRVIEKQNLFLQATLKLAPVLTMEEDVELDSFATINKGAAGAGEMDERAAAAEHKAAEAQAKLKEIEAKIAEAEKKAEEAAAMVEDAERRAQAAEEKAVQAEHKLQVPDAAEDTTAQAEAAADANPQEAPEEVEDAEESEEELSEETEAESDDAEEAEAEDDDAEEAEAEDDDAEEAETESEADEEDDFESPVPGSFAAMIAARAAEAALRGKTGSKERAEEKTIGEEPAAEAKAETVTWEPEEKPAQVAEAAEPIVEKVKEVPAKEEPKTERLERTTGRVSMREAARRAGIIKK